MCVLINWRAATCFCGVKCYQRLVRFQRASDKLEKMKKEIEEDFNARENLKEKRLGRLNERREQS